jgi:gluconolactonase
MVEVRIDKGEPKVVDLFHHYSRGLNYPRTRVFADGLAPGKHVLELKVLEKHNPKSKGTACTILYLAVNNPDGVNKPDAGLVAPGAKLEKLATDMKFTEGPVWIPSKKKVIFSDIPNSKLMQWSKADGLSVFRESKNANGNLLDLEGRLLSCQHSGRALVRTEKDGSITVLADKFDGKRFNSPNDVAIKSDGTLWFTDPPWGLRGGKREIDGHWVYRLDPDGKVSVVCKALAMPNGIAFSPDEKRLYVADTGGHRMVQDPKLKNAPAKIHVFDVKDDNTISPAFTIDGRCDGMAVDVRGNIYTTAREGVVIFSPEGKKLALIETPEGTANCCFGGEDYKTLFITARKSLYAIKMSVKGARPLKAKW